VIRSHISEDEAIAGCLLCGPPSSNNVFPANLTGDTHFHHVQGVFCGACLLMRYGEIILDVEVAGPWECPPSASGNIRRPLHPFKNRHCTIFFYAGSILRGLPVDALLGEHPGGDDRWTLWPSINVPDWTIQHVRTAAQMLTCVPLTVCREYSAGTACSCAMGRISWRWRLLDHGSARPAGASATAPSIAFAAAGPQPALCTAVPLPRVRFRCHSLNSNLTPCMKCSLREHE